MRSFRDVSIRTKLFALLTAVVGMALLISSAASVFNDVRRIKSSMVEHYTVLADVLGANSTAALNFEAPTTAEEVLSSLHLEPAVTFACTYDARGKVFATYRANADSDFSAPPVRTDSTSFSADGNIEVFKKITQDKQTLGTIYLRVSMERVDAQIKYNISIAVIVLLVALAAAILLGWRLQRTLTQPILQLARATEAVSHKADYSLRVQRQADDELGLLCDGFNAMLAQIQKRDAELAHHRLHLEELVHERTRNLEGKTQELARSNAELEQFAYIASHDLQEPLRKVQSFGDLLSSQAGAALGEEERGYLTRMQAAAQRMQNLINDLLAFARVTRQAKPFEPVDLNRVVREVLSDLETRIKTSEGRVEVGPMPLLDCDPLQMRQLVQNLIANALKFHRPNVPPVIAVDSRTVKNGDGLALLRSPSDQLCEITVRDNGIGFDETYLDRIFLPFQRLHGRGKYEGTGMGLAICRKIVERHGGTITARSITGQGTTFIVLLPLHQPKGDERHA